MAKQSAHPLPGDEDEHAPGPESPSCEREPIHAPGAIQRHGAMLVALADGLRVSHASANLEEIFGCPAASVLGRTLEEAIGKDTSRLLMNDRMLDASGSTLTSKLPNPRGGLFHLQAHRTGRHVCVDIEQVTLEEMPHRPVITLEEVLKTFEYAASGAELCELVVDGLKAISGYDRVMAYRFVEAGHGEVIAEAREAHLDAYLGLRYPASDIPPQARRLYVRQRVGAIVDSAAAPVPLLADTVLDDGTPLDLTHSTLRSVSPIHREYMRNMNTAASLTIGLARGTDLWGMLVCHHGTARAAPPGLRAAAGAIGLVVSLLLAKLEEASAHAQRLERSQIMRDLVENMQGSHPISEALAAGSSLLRLVDAGGAMLSLAGKQLFVGNTPDPSAAASALAALQSCARGEVLAMDNLGLRFPELAACTSEGSGALLLRLATGSEDAVLWFRPEEARTVTWGGNPSEHVNVDPVSKRMSPRSSFKAWEDKVCGHSIPWTEIELGLAGELGAAIQAESASRTKVELRETQARLGMLAEHSDVVVTLSDLDGTRRYVSPSAERVLSWQPEDLVGRSALDFVHPGDHKALLDAINAMKSNGQSSTSYRFRRKDASWIWVDSQARLRMDADGQEPQDYVVVLRDASERKAVEMKLREALDLMERMAATDGLTGLANRRQLDVQTGREWRRCVREHLPLSALLLDADRFKLFNDRYGHLAGDDCLRAIASQMAAVAKRPCDIAARYGGEEFVLLLPGTEEAGALLLAERLRRLIQQLGIEHERNDEFGVVTVSIGVATAWPRATQSEVAEVEKLFKAADAALYRAKRAGRNQVMAH